MIPTVLLQNPQQVQLPKVRSLQQAQHLQIQLQNQVYLNQKVLSLQIQHQVTHRQHPVNQPITIAQQIQQVIKPAQKKVQAVHQVVHLVQKKMLAVHQIQQVIKQV